jgi:hypothetical protein
MYASREEGGGTCSPPGFMKKSKLKKEGNIVNTRIIPEIKNVNPEFSSAIRKNIKRRVLSSVI